MSPTVLSESKTELERESYDQNGENGKFGHSDRRVSFLGDIARDDATWAMSHGKVARPCDYDCENANLALSHGILARNSR